LQEKTATVIDIQIERGLKELADAIILKQKGVQQINDINREYRQEYGVVQKVAAQLVTFLHKYSMLGGNHDTVMDYFDFLITQEQRIVQARSNRTRITALENDRQTYREFLESFTLDSASGIESQLFTEEDVETTVKSLCELKHWGQTLKQIVKEYFNLSYQGGFRECIVGTKDDGSGGLQTRACRAG
jgi:hypothetical protein